MDCIPYDKFVNKIVVKEPYSCYFKISRHNTSAVNNTTEKSTNDSLVADECQLIIPKD